MIVDLKTAINKAQSFQELLPITKELCAGLSSWGYQYATVTAQSPMYQGTIAIGSIAEKAMKIRQRMEQNAVNFTPEEKENVILLSREVSRLYGEDTVNCERADRITTLCRLVMSLIFWVNHQSKWNSNKNGPSYREQLQQPLSISLKTAVNKAQNFQELLPIANELHAGLSWWGYQYAYVPTSTSIDKDVVYTGRVAIGVAAEKAMKIKLKMKKSIIEYVEFIHEKRCIFKFCKKIYCLYVEDKSLCNQANKLTTVCRLFTRVIFWANHQGKWGDILPTAKFSAYPDRLCQGLDIPQHMGAVACIGMSPTKGEKPRLFMEDLLEWKKQGATYIPYPNGT